MSGSSRAPPARNVAFAHRHPKSANSDCRRRSRGSRTPTAFKEDLVAQQTKSKSTRKSSGGRSKPRSNSSTSKRTTKSRANSSGSQTQRGTQSRAGSTARKRTNSSNSSSNRGHRRERKGHVDQGREEHRRRGGVDRQEAEDSGGSRRSWTRGPRRRHRADPKPTKEGAGRSTARARHHQEPRRRCEEHRCARRARRSYRRAGTGSRRGARERRGSPIPDRGRPPGPDEAVPSSKVRLTSASTQPRQPSYMRG